MENSSNFNLVRKLAEKEHSIPPKDISLLNSVVHSELNKKIFAKAALVKEMSSEQGGGVDKVQFDLFMTPEIAKINKMNKLFALKRNLEAINEKLGNWTGVRR